MSDNADKLGDSYNIAKAKFLTLDQRLLQQPQLKKYYLDLLEEYVKLGHMSPLCEADLKKNTKIFTSLITHY
jgi:hypothetical protein